MKNIYVLLFFYLVVYVSTEEKKGFLVAAPSTLLTDSLENICVSLHNNSGPVQVSVTLRGTYTSDVLSTSSLSVKSASCLELYVPRTDEQLGRLIVHLQSTDDPELTSNSEQAVQLQKDPLVILVATNKPLYKPGQDVSFRVLSLTHTLKPYTGKIHKISIENPSGIRVHQWNNIEMTKYGLVQLQFSLDEEPFLGQWKIKIQQDSKTVEKGFWVKEYVPPKFKVVVQAPSEVHPDSKNLSWHICAKYPYGQVVHGDAHIEIKLQGCRIGDQPSINNAAKLNSYTGCMSVTVDGTVLGLSDPSIHPTAVQVIVTVTEKGTGVSHSGFSVSPVHNGLFSLQFQCSHYFKPGLPYKGNVVMRNMDGRLRQRLGEKIQVCVKLRYRGELAMKLVDCWNYTTDFSSHVVFALPDISDPFNVQIITLTATAPDHPTKLYPGSAEIMMLQPSAMQIVKPWFSQSHSFLDVWTRTTLVCSTTHYIPVYYSVPSANASTPHFFYLIEGRGDLLMLNSTVPGKENIIHSNEVSPNEVSLVRSWRLPIQVTHEMSPQSRLTVYYVRTDGEVVAGSTNLIIDRCFQNKVRVRWEKLQVSPKEETQLSIRASPYSMCDVSVTNRELDFNSSHIKSDVENVWVLLNKFIFHIPPRDNRVYCFNKNEKEDESPPSYELRKKRSLMMFPRDFSDHVDSITAFDDLGVTVVSNLVIESRPCTRPVYSEGLHHRSWNFPQNGIDTEPIIADNLMLVVQPEPVATVGDDTVKSLVRDYFPDTWLWSLVFTGREGEVTVNSSAPDTITSWDTKVTCISERDGLGIATPVALSVFTPFFVHLEIPYSIKKGESVSIKAIVYNYMHHQLPIVLRVPENKKLHVTPSVAVRFCVKPMSPHSHVVSVTAKTAGTVNVTAHAQIEPIINCGPPDLPSKSDTIIRHILVKNDGYMQQKSQSAFICPTEDTNPSVTWDLELPEADNLVPGSARLQFTVVGDLFGPALQNLDSLVLLPMGCGEQNLARLAPNLFVLKYMEALRLGDKQIKSTALKNIKKGYQRQLTFQRSDGSFSAFGETDVVGSMWLTAAVVKTLSAAKGIINIDEDVLQNSVVWITKQQLENGCFPTIGQVFHRGVEGEEAEALATTAFSALIVTNLAVKEVKLPATLRSNAEFCLTAGITSTDPYTLSLTTLALIRLGLRQKAVEAMHSLLRLAIIQNDVIHWGKLDASVSHNIVITSYAVLSLVELGGPQHMINAQKAVRWISNHRNENGGFISTQDTVVALEALTAYTTALPPVNRTELVVTVTGDQLARTFRLFDDNKLVQQRMITTDVPRSLTVSVVGDGCAFTQSVLKYNVKRPETGSLLDLQVTTAPVSTIDPCSVQELRLCAMATKPSQITGMALLTVMMVTGFSPDRAHLKKISHPHIKKWEEDEDQIAFYLTDVNNLPVCVSLLLIHKFEVEDSLPAIVTLIDYYHPEIFISKSYSVVCSPVVSLENRMLSDSSVSGNNRFDDFHNVDFDLEVPSGIEGPKPVYTCPPNTTISQCNP